VLRERVVIRRQRGKIHFAIGERGKDATQVPADYR
jgi:hypothetical protein